MLRSVLANRTRSVTLISVYSSFTGAVRTLHRRSASSVFAECICGATTRLGRAIREAVTDWLYDEPAGAPAFAQLRSRMVLREYSLGAGGPCD
jgi:hypothetical protein